MVFDFNAGKVAVFVWPAYGVTIAVFIVLIADSLARARRWKRAAKAQATDTDA